jgi:hypothetical protein
MLALFLNKPVCSLDELIYNIEPSSGERPLAAVENKKKKIFIVDDSIHSGHALRDTKLRLESIDTSKYEIKFLVIYGRKQTVHARRDLWSLRRMGQRRANIDSERSKEHITSKVMLSETGWRETRREDE